MKKIFTLSFVTICILSLSFKGYSQSTGTVKKNIESANKRFISWFNSGKADSIITQYHVDACITGKGCGKDFIKSYYQSQTGQYAVKELNTLGITVKDNIATETGQWKIQLANGAELSGKYSTEWERVNYVWLIRKETQE